MEIEKVAIKKHKNISIQQIVLAGMVIIVAIGWWLSLSSFFQAKTFSLANLLTLLVVFISFVALLSLFYFLVNSFLLAITISLIGVLSSVLFFGTDWIYLSALLLLLIGWLVSARKIQCERKSRIRINLTRSLFRGISLILIGLFVVITVAYYLYSPSLEEEVEIKLVSPEIITTVVLPLSQTLDLGNKIPPLKQFIDNSEKLSQKLTFTQARDLSRQMGIKFKENEIVLDGFSRYLNQQINQFIGPYREYVSIGLTIALFLLLMGLLIPFRCLIILIVWIIWKLLVMLHLISIETINQPVEVVNF